MNDTLQSKIKYIHSLFAPLTTPEARYDKIIALGRDAPPLAPEHKIPANRVPGCQSTLYLHSRLKDDLLHFHTQADALISAGIARLLTEVFSGESPETILTTPPTYLQELGITASLSPTRTNGLASLHLRMKQEALKILSANLQ